MPFSVHNVTNDGFGRKYYDFDLRRVVSFVSASAIRLLVKLGLIDEIENIFRSVNASGAIIIIQI